MTILLSICLFVFTVGYELHSYQSHCQRSLDKMCQHLFEELSKSFRSDQWEQLLRELCRRCRNLGFPETYMRKLETASPDDFHRLTVCKCEEQSTINMGDMVVPSTTLLNATGDPDPDFPGPDRACGIVQYFPPPPDYNVIQRTLHQPHNTEDIPKILI